VSKPVPSLPRPKRRPVAGMNCIGPAAPAREDRMHAAVGLLGHDPEQQRLGQAVALERRPHQVRMYW
jgi:hypothetical protein